MSNTLLWKNKKASGAIAAYRLVKATANDGEVAVATNPTDALMGTTGILDAADGQAVDIAQGGHSEVQVGGAVGHGDPLTAGAGGKAVVANPGAGVRHRIIGFAAESGTADAVIAYVFAPGFITG